jgi:SAM-dependent methyltransferase
VSELKPFPAPSTASLQDGYTFANVDRQLEFDRIRRIEAMFDPASRRLLDACGLAPGARCLEIGAGAGSIALWLAERAGEQGEVVAVDLDASFLRASLPTTSRVRVVEGDARRALASAHFDLVHARYVLVHNADWESLLDAIVASLRPGAALLVEEPEFTAAKAGFGADASAFDRVNAAICAMFRGASKDPMLGVRLPAALEQRGLRVECTENHTPLCRGGDPVAAMMAMSTRQLRGRYLATGLVDESDLEGYLRFASDPTAWGIYYATISVLARKGAAPQ